ncbi:MAG: divalent metal cation transporter [Nitrososphaerota archaeon]|nr:divalent metal cation transporter [Nitrososphaerota archaeon]
MKLGPRLYYSYRRIRKHLAILAAIIGPGIMVMVADNDAGGITTYTVTGATFYYSFIWVEIMLGPVAYVCQEMTVRLGAITKRGHAEAIFDAFGSFWGWFSLSDLTLTDVLTIVTEFIGMTTAMSIFGIPPVLTEIFVIAFIMMIVINGRYWTWEKIVLLLCVVNLIYVPAAFLVHPNLSSVFFTGVIPGFPYGFNSPVIFLLMANVGTTIAPWMIFFQQSSVVDKSLKQKDIPYERIDTAVGSFFTVLVAVVLIIVAGALLGGTNVTSAAQAAKLIMPINRTVGVVMAIGLFDAGLLGAIAISMASSWAFGEVFGWAHSLNTKVRQAPWFNLFRLFVLIVAGAIVLIPGAPLVLITLFVQVIAVTLLPAALVFLILLLNQEEIVGKYKNTRFQNAFAISVVTILIILSTLYGVGTIFPHLFG